VTSAHWTPGIGDPTIAGWVTVVVYFLAAALCFRASAAPVLIERRWWTGLSMLMILMGINKQLDIQTLFTDIGRDMARAQGWYGEHRMVQGYFIVGLVVSGLIIAATLALTLGRKSGPWARVAMLATCGLGVFVLIRATSFHHVDDMLGLKLGGLRYNNILEMGPLLVIALAAWKAAGWKTRGQGDEHA
jgi:hypothetical protein